MRHMVSLLLYDIWTGPCETLDTELRMPVDVFNHLRTVFQTPCEQELRFILDAQVREVIGKRSPSPTQDDSLSSKPPLDIDDVQEDFRIELQHHIQFEAWLSRLVSEGPSGSGLDGSRISQKELNFIT